MSSPSKIEPLLLDSDYQYEINQTITDQLPNLTESLENQSSQLQQEQNVDMDGKTATKHISDYSNDNNYKKHKKTKKDKKDKKSKKNSSERILSRSNYLPAYTNFQLNNNITSQENTDEVQLLQQILHQNLNKKSKKNKHKSKYKHKNDTKDTSNDVETSQENVNNNHTAIVDHEQTTKANGLPTITETALQSSNSSKNKNFVNNNQSSTPPLPSSLQLPQTTQPNQSTSPAPNQQSNDPPKDILTWSDFFNQVDLRFEVVRFTIGLIIVILFIYIVSYSMSHEFYYQRKNRTSWVDLLLKDNRLNWTLSGDDSIFDTSDMFDVFDVYSLTVLVHHMVKLYFSTHTSVDNFTQVTPAVKLKVWYNNPVLEPFTQQISPYIPFLTKDITNLLDQWSKTNDLDFSSSLQDDLLIKLSFLLDPSSQSLSTTTTTTTTMLTQNKKRQQRPFDRIFSPILTLHAGSSQSSPSIPPSLDIPSYSSSSLTSSYHSSSASVTTESSLASKTLPHTRKSKSSLYKQYRSVVRQSSTSLISYDIQQHHRNVYTTNQQKLYSLESMIRKVALKRLNNIKMHKDLLYNQESIISQDMIDSLTDALNDNTPLFTLSSSPSSKNQNGLSTTATATEERSPEIFNLTLDDLGPFQNGFSRPQDVHNWITSQHVSVIDLSLHVLHFTFQEHRSCLFWKVHTIYTVNPGQAITGRIYAEDDLCRDVSTQKVTIPTQQTVYYHAGILSILWVLIWSAFFVYCIKTFQTLSTYIKEYWYRFVLIWTRQLLAQTLQRYEQHQHEKHQHELLLQQQQLQQLHQQPLIVSDNENHYAYDSDHYQSEYNMIQNIDDIERNQNTHNNFDDTASIASTALTFDDTQSLQAYVSTYTNAQLEQQQQQQDQYHWLVKAFLSIPCFHIFLSKKTSNTSPSSSSSSTTSSPVISSSSSPAISPSSSPYLPPIILQSSTSQRISRPSFHLPSHQLPLPSQYETSISTPIQMVSSQPQTNTMFRTNSHFFPASVGQSTLSRTTTTTPAPAPATTATSLLPQQYYNHQQQPQQQPQQQQQQQQQRQNQLPTLPLPLPHLDNQISSVSSEYQHQQSHTPVLTAAFSSAATQYASVTTNDDTHENTPIGAQTPRSISHSTTQSTSNQQLSLLFLPEHNTFHQIVHIDINQPYGLTTASLFFQIALIYQYISLLSQRREKYPEFYAISKLYFFALLGYSLLFTTFFVVSVFDQAPISLSNFTLQFLFSCICGFSPLFLLPTLNKLPLPYTVWQKSFVAALPSLVPLLIGNFPIFMGFSFISWLLFATYAKRFETLDSTAMHLFAVMKGDEVRDVFREITDGAPSPFYAFIAQVVLYAFCLYFLLILYKMILSVVGFFFADTRAPPDDDGQASTTTVPVPSSSDSSPPSPSPSPSSASSTSNTITQSSPATSTAATTTISSTTPNASPYHTPQHPVISLLDSISPIPMFATPEQQSRHIELSDASSPYDYQELSSRQITTNQEMPEVQEYPPSILSSIWTTCRTKIQSFVNYIDYNQKYPRLTLQQDDHFKQLIECFRDLSQYDRTIQDSLSTFNHSSLYKRHMTRFALENHIVKQYLQYTLHPQDHINMIPTELYQKDDISPMALSSAIYHSNVIFIFHHKGPIISSFRPKKRHNRRSRRHHTNQSSNISSTTITTVPTTDTTTVTTTTLMPAPNRIKTRNHPTPSSTGNTLAINSFTDFNTYVHSPQHSVNQHSSLNFKQTFNTISSPTSFDNNNRQVYKIHQISRQQQHQEPLSPKIENDDLDLSTKIHIKHEE